LTDVTGFNVGVALAAVESPARARAVARAAVAVRVRESMKRTPGSDDEHSGHCFGNEAVAEAFLQTVPSDVANSLSKLAAVIRISSSGAVAHC
jgi:hypothetical protein